MANLQAPFGLKPSRYRDGTAWNGATNLYWIPASDTNQYNVGDTVLTAAGGDANGIPQIVKDTAGTATIRGVIAGILISAPNLPNIQGINLDLTVQNAPATKARDYYALVVDDQGVLFEAQDDGITTANLVAASSNKNASLTVANPTSPQQNSASVINSSSIATTATLNLKLMGLKQAPGNAYGAYATWIVMINQHELMGGTAGH